MKIERLFQRTPAGEEPWRTKDGYYVLADPKIGRDWHHSENAIYAQTLEEAAIQTEGLAIRMYDPGYLDVSSQAFDGPEGLPQIPEFA